MIAHLVRPHLGTTSIGEWQVVDHVEHRYAAAEHLVVGAAVVDSLAKHQLANVTPDQIGLRHAKEFRGESVGAQDAIVAVFEDHADWQAVKQRVEFVFMMSRL